MQNGTWVGHRFASGLSHYTKLYPAYINDDNYIDLFVFEANGNISWIDNIRGASEELNLRNISQENSAGFQIVDFDSDGMQDVLQITSVGSSGFYNLDF